MKKLNLNTAAFQEGEVLTRSQLKKVVGGDNLSISNQKCQTHDDCPIGQVCVRTSQGSICCTSDELHDPSHACGGA